MITTIRLTENDNSEGCDSTLQIGHLFGLNGLKLESNGKSSKTSI